MEHASSFEPGAAPYRMPERPAVAIHAIIRDLDATALEGADPVYPVAALTGAARRVCTTARAEGLFIEQALVSVKHAWRSTPGRPKPRSGASDAVLDQLVSLCIREFFASADD